MHQIAQWRTVPVSRDALQTALVVFLTLSFVLTVGVIGLVLIARGSA